MKRNLQLLTVLLILTNSSYSQNNWEWLNPKPSGYTGVDIHFSTSDTGFIINNNQLLITTDCGENWTIHKEISSSNDINFFNSLGFIVGNYGYVLKSNNYGISWEAMNIGSTENMNSVNIINEDTIVISSSNKLFKTFDGGNNWQNITIPNYAANKTFFLNSKVGHAACNSGKIMKTIDGGETWYITESVSYFPSDFFTIYFVNSDIGFSSREHNDILKTTDGGETWVEIENTSDAIYSFYFFDEQNGYIAGDHGVIFKTNSGGKSWDWVGFQSGRIYATTINSLYFIDANIGFAVGMRGRILKTTDGGQTWNAYSPIYNDIRQITFTNDSIGYLITGSEVYKTVNKGYSWSNLELGSSERLYKMNFFNKDTGIIAGSWQKLYKTYDGGNTWKTITIDNYRPNIESMFFINDSIGYISGDYDGLDRFVAKTTDAGELWVTVSSYNFSFDDLLFFNENIGIGLRNGDLYKTTDGGVNWEMIYEIYGDLNQMQIINDSVAYIAGEFNTVLKTTNRGESWIELKTDYDHLLAVCFFNENIGFVTSEYGYIFKTVNGGYSWEKENIPGIINSIFINKNRNIYAAGINGVILKDTIFFDEFSLKLNPIEDFSDDNANLSGIIASNGNKIDSIRFEYGLSYSFNNSIDATPNTINPNKADSVFAELNNLESNSEYYCRLVIQYEGIEYISNYETFTTLSEINALNETNDYSSINIFPNPTKDYFIVKSSEPVERIEVFDSKGKLLFIKSNEELFDISGYPAGLYFIRIYTNDKQIIRKMIKN